MGTHETKQQLEITLNLRNNFKSGRGATYEMQKSIGSEEEEG